MQTLDQKTNPMIAVSDHFFFCFHAFCSRRWVQLVDLREGLASILGVSAMRHDDRMSLGVFQFSPYIHPEIQLCHQVQAVNSLIGCVDVLEDQSVHSRYVPANQNTSPRI